jgi:hypothetical protein
VLQLPHGFVAAACLPKQSDYRRRRIARNFGKPAVYLWCTPVRRKGRFCGIARIENPVSYVFSDPLMGSTPTAPTNLTQRKNLGLRKSAKLALVSN